MSPVRRDQTKGGKVLVVDDEPTEREGLARMVGQWGYEVETASSGEEALELVETHHPAVVVTDLVLPEMDGLTLLQKLKETGRPPAVLLVTGHATVESAVEAMRHGAFDYLTKPVDATRLQVLLEKSIEQESLSREVNFLRHQLRQKGSFGQLVGQAKGMHEVYRWIELAATSTAPVLVYGESGTGKELVARTIHDLSNRRNRAFVAINCAAIPETLIESELFGHEKGAFTGAVSRKIGRFELADGGTIFLDEIGDLSLELQVKLLRVLQEGEIERVGGTRTMRVDVRVIAATHHNLGEAAKANRFRSDLFYRLNVFPIETPTLRHRKDDIPLLVRHFALQYGVKLGKRIETIPKRTLDLLMAYDWPGNIRELRNVIERALIITQGTALELPDWAPGEAPASEAGVQSLDDVERDYIIAVLEQRAWRVSGPKGAASLLGLKPTTLEARMKKLGIQRPSFPTFRERPN